MPVFRVAYTEETWRACEVVAETWEDAQDKFWAGDYDLSTDRVTGSEIQDSVDVEEVK